MTNPASDPITAKVLFEHVAGLRAEVAALRTVAEGLSLESRKAREHGAELLDAARELRRVAASLADEVLALNEWRKSVDARLEARAGNGAHAI